MMLFFTVLVEWIEGLMFGRGRPHGRSDPSLDDETDTHPQVRGRT